MAHLTPHGSLQGVVVGIYHVLPDAQACIILIWPATVADFGLTKVVDKRRSNRQNCAGRSIHVLRTEELVASGTYKVKFQHGFGEDFVLNAEIVIVYVGIVDALREDN